MKINTVLVIHALWVMGDLENERTATIHDDPHTS